MFLKHRKIYFLTIGLAAVLTSLFLVAPSLAGYQIEMGLPNLPSGSAVSNPGQYIQYFFIFGLSLIGFLAVAALAAGGIMWMVGGSITSVEKAKNIIVGAISGVVLLLCSYLLLYTIDPKLTDLTPHIKDLGKIEEAKKPKQQTPSDCNLATQVWSPSQGKCVTKSSGYGTAQCQAGSPTCSEAICAPGGCAVAFQQWNKSKCCCINLDSGLCD